MCKRVNVKCWMLAIYLFCIALCAYSVAGDNVSLSLSAENAEELLVSDWLYQADNAPEAIDLQNEITWARQIAGRINTEVGKGFCVNELKKLLEIENEINIASGKQPLSAETLNKYYIAIRRVKREIIFKDPAIDFDELLFIDNPLPMKWVKESPHYKADPKSPFAYSNEWQHESQHRNGFNAMPGGRLLVLKGFSPGGKVRQLAPITDQRQGAFLRPDISFDAKKVLVSFVPEDEINYHIYEMNIDGTGLKQLTFGKHDDNDPIYLPDGKIMFTTTRGNTYVRCMHHSYSTVLARCDADGENIYLISRNSEPDWLPSLLSDGSVVYTRWEYSDKGLMRLQGLWNVNSDGTNVNVTWGNQSVSPDHLASARQIPGTNKIMFSGVGHHIWYFGSIGIIDPREGREYPDGLYKVTADVPFGETGDGQWHSYSSTVRKNYKGPKTIQQASEKYHASGSFESYKTPFPISENLFLVSAMRGTPKVNVNKRAYRFPDKFKLYLMDIDGNKELIYEGQHHIFHAMPVKTRKKPQVRPSTVQWPGTGENRKTQKPGTFYTNNVYEGSGIPKGKAKYLRIVQQDYRTFTTWLSAFYLAGPIPCPQVSATSLDSVKRVLGTVPVEKDVSVSFNAPSGKQIYFQLLDEDYRCLQTMRSFTGVMPGEMRGCVGCHERRMGVPENTAKRAIALSRGPSEILPPPWGTKSINYSGMIQPIFNKHCKQCHMGDGKARQKLDLTFRESRSFGGQFSEPYLTLLGSSAYMGYQKTKKNYAGGFDVSGAGKTNVKTQWRLDEALRTAKPMTHLSYTSPLLNMLRGGKHNKVNLSDEEMRLLTVWVDCNAPYRGDEDIRSFEDPDFYGIETLPIRPLLKNAPIINRP